MRRHTQTVSTTVKLSSLVILFALTACGGGGDSSSSAVATTTAPPSSTTPSPTTSPAPAPASVPGISSAGFPSTGAYASLLTAEGSSTALRAGLSLIHPSNRSVEYQIEPISSNVTASILVNGGLVDIATTRVSSLVPNSMIYIAGGDIKRLPMVATGADPKAGIQTAGVTSLCKFILEPSYAAPQGTDYAAPLASKYFASTKGADGICDTSDDGQAEITFTAAGKPVATVLDITSSTGQGRALAVLRNPTTLKPSAVVYGRSVVVSQPTPATYSFAAPTSPALTKLVETSVDSLIGELNSRLIALSADGKSTALDATITAGTGWESAGFDSNSFYVYRNSAPIANFSTSTWRLIRISRASPTATLLASGSGNLALAAMGNNSIFATVLSASGYSLNRISKTVSGAPVLLQGPSTNQVSTVLASTAGTHMVMRTNLVNGAASSITIDLVDEVSNAAVYSQANAFVLDAIRPDSLFLNYSVEVTGYALLGDFLSSGSLGANLITYNAVNKSATVMGRFPAAAEFGSPRALTATGGSTGTDFATGSLLAVSGTTYLTTPRRYFSFDPRVANSIQYTTTVR